MFHLSISTHLSRYGCCVCDARRTHGVTPTFSHTHNPRRNLVESGGSSTSGPRAIAATLSAMPSAFQSSPKESSTGSGGKGGGGGGVARVKPLPQLPPWRQTKRDTHDQRARVLRRNGQSSEVSAVLPCVAVSEGCSFPVAHALSLSS